MKFIDRGEQLSKEWAEADEISDRIVELLNERAPMVAAEQVLVGVLLALLGFLKTAEGINVPQSLVELQRWSNVVVGQMVATGPQKGREREQ